MTDVNIILTQSPGYSYIEDLQDWVGKHIRRTDVMCIGGEAINAIQKGDVFKLISVDEEDITMKRDRYTFIAKTAYFADGGWEFAY